MARYTKHVTRKGRTPQSKPIPGSTQVPNSAGGYAWQTDNWLQLDRFLILGSLGGTYYVGESELTQENADVIRSLVAEDGKRVVNQIVDVSHSGRAPKNDPAIFALALCLTYGNNDTRRAAEQALPQVCRTGTHLFTMAQSIKDLRGWGRAVRRAFSNWYENKDAKQLAYQMVKYVQRAGMSHRDVLRLAHPSGVDLAHKALYQYAVKADGLPAEIVTDREQVSDQYDVKIVGSPSKVVTRHRPKATELFNWAEELPLIWAHEEAKKADSAGKIVKLIDEFKIPRESIPSQFMDNRDVWYALLENSLPLTAMIRNLANMTRVGLLANGSSATKTVMDRLRNKDYIRKSRIHPISVLVALKTYEKGHGFRGTKTWNPVTRIVDALDDAFYLAFDNVEPTGKRIKLAIDVSGSMSSYFCTGERSLTCREGSAAMALVTARTEPNYDLVAFSDRMIPISISPRERLDDVLRKTDRLPWGGTDCSLPISEALAKNETWDAFINYTDNETWAGDSGHPAELLSQYRSHTGVRAKMVTVAMESNRYSIGDPNDPGSLDIVGFDTSTPQVITDFVGKDD